MAATGGCHITKGANNRPQRKSKSPAPNKKLPPNTKKPQSPNTTPNTISTNNKSSNSQPNANSPSSNKPVQKQAMQYKIKPKSPPSPQSPANTDTTNNAKNSPKPSSGNVTNNTMATAVMMKPNLNSNAMPLAKPQKISSYHMPPNLAYHHHHHGDDHKHQFPATANNKYVPSDTGNKEKYRVKNRPAQYSIADKLLAQQNQDELERMAEEEEERELKQKAKQIGGAPLQSANNYNVKK